MNRRDTLPEFTESDGRMPSHLELGAADHEEPTWEVRHPAKRRRFDRRARLILGAAAIAALLANAGAAWAYWRFNNPAAERDWASGTVVEVTVTAISDPGRPLRPGAPGNLTVTVTNQHEAPVRVTEILPAEGAALADEVHRDAGCADPPVEFTREAFPVSWEVPRNTVGAFILDGALAVRAGGDAACEGATYTVPVRATAVRP
ncbi:hypothetical protein Aph02nite_55220 [Actinoplanes philippinensis]|uniref:Uncharacterized protein n=1 Tax=Actinoplanes philippinensis TaxID=35752 RepID=A0A1I2J7P7_9ACTN|nr:hypothetical protein [Actinoplanes philippinensis]GIE79572.1 hypothetical protein Aph02nite_55220 [Actinoplanes philippinensis]SFF49227.1 hypothetical protein SAMN05421541_111280 [Actinoplanes philippinensis]